MCGYFHIFTFKKNSVKYSFCVIFKVDLSSRLGFNPGLQASEECRSSSSPAPSPSDSTASKFQIKLKDAMHIKWENSPLACEQAHVVSYSREYLGGGRRRAKRAGEKNGARKSAPARKPLNFKFSAFVHERSILIGLK